MGRTLKPSTPFAQRLIEARGAVSRVELAGLLGCPVETLGNYERGRTFPDLAMLARLKRVLGVSLDWLLTGEGSMRGIRDEGSSAYPLDERLLRQIAEEIVLLFEAEQRPLSPVDLVIMVAAWYNDLTVACRSAEEQVVGLRVMLQRLRR